MIISSAILLSIIFIVAFSSSYVIDKLTNFLFRKIHPYFSKGFYRDKYGRETAREISKIICSKLNIEEVDVKIKNLIDKTEKRLKKQKRIEKLNEINKNTIR